MSAAVTSRPSGVAVQWSTRNRKRYKGITIETVAAWPDGVIVATLCSPDADGNFFAAVNRCRQGE